MIPAALWISFQHWAIPFAVCTLLGWLVYAIGKSVGYERGKKAGWKKCNQFHESQRGHTDW